MTPDGVRERHARVLARYREVFPDETTVSGDADSLPDMTRSTAEMVARLNGRQPLTIRHGPGVSVRHREG